MVRGDGGFTEGMLFVLFFIQGDAIPPQPPSIWALLMLINAKFIWPKIKLQWQYCEKLKKKLIHFFSRISPWQDKKIVSIQIPPPPPPNSQFIVFHNSDLFSEMRDINLLFWEEHSELWDINSQLQEIKSDLLDKKLQLRFFIRWGKTVKNCEFISCNADFFLRIPSLYFTILKKSQNWDIESHNYYIVEMGFCCFKFKCIFTFHLFLW